MSDVRTAIVTGASRGIGREIALRLVGNGWQVAALATSAQNLARVEADAAGLPGTLRRHVVDVADPAGVAAVVTSVEEEHGHIDLLVNNAGIGEASEQPIWKADIEDWWRVIAVNLRGPMLTMHAVLPGMLGRGTGRVVNIGSLRNITAIPIETAYAASKAGLTRLTTTVQSGLAGTGVHVFELSPGRVRTDIIGASIADAPAHTWTPIERVADFVERIAAGELDALAGRFLHARDDIDVLLDRAEDIVDLNGRVLTLTKAFEGDPLRYPGELQPSDAVTSGTSR